MQDDTRLQKKPSFFLLERVRIPNTVIDSCQKQVLSLSIGCVIMRFVCLTKPTWFIKMLREESKFELASSETQANGLQ